ncbi:arsenic resistance N-acetyltransferase ArsN2 [Luteimonas sp. WGS1318]|uniref:arsenic resistance N-acetyltransferase ArsN2 n=1 Tax=Luteimonas sp. WGS1318 TaxID=3366815 RepID=UPI00372D602F
MPHSIQPIELNQSVEALLLANSLPAADLRGKATATLFGCIEDAALHGVVGLEIYDHVALLRSLVVPATECGRGLGTALVSHAEHYAADSGVDTIYLLTTTAAGFFERHGYRHVPRQTAPSVIAGTHQFSGLCPSSSAFMAKSVGS